MEYFDIYKKRLNRYGEDYQTRIQTERERLFSLYLKKTTYLVEFTYNEELRYGSLEPYSQDNTKTLQYLLTPMSEELDIGTVLLLTNKKGQQWRYLVYFKDDHAANGYNKYAVLKITNLITWISRDKERCEVWAYFYGQEDNMLKDELKSRSRSQILYNENLKLSFFVCPLDNRIKKEDYFEIQITDSNNVTTTEAYVVTGFDKISTPGIEYVSVDPVYIYSDDDDKKVIDEEYSGEDYYWITGGDN